VSLPLYVNLPYHYASVAGAAGGLWAPLLATRIGCPGGPAIGRQADRLLRQGTASAAAAAALAAC
jgi:hypothetical protein